METEAAESTMLKKYLENKKMMIKVIESWSENHECWARGFLSWNRENQHYGKYAKELQTKAKEKGIDLIIDHDFALQLLNRPDSFSHVFHVSFVLLSLDYVSSEKCMLELLWMEKLKMRPHPIHFFTDDELQRNPIPYYRFHQFSEFANKTIGTKDDVVIQTIFNDYFYGRMDEFEPLSADLPLSQVMFDVTMRNWFPHYHSFPAIDTWAEKVYKYMTTDQQVCDGVGNDQIMYLGLMGSNNNYNEFIARNACLPHRLSDFRVTRFDMLRYRGYFGPESKDMPYENMLYWGLANVQLLLEISSHKKLLYGELDEVYKGLVDELPEKKCLVLIENIAYYDQLKALANVLDFLTSGSRIVFTTTNESFFAKCNPSWELESHSDGLPTLARCKGQMLDANELESLKKVQRDLSFKQQQCESVEKTGTSSDEKQEPPSHEDGGSTSDEEGGGAQKKPRVD